MPLHRAVVGLTVGILACNTGCGSRPSGLPVHDRDAGNAHACRNAPAQRRHVVLVIGDGMQVADQVATSRYLHGSDRGLSWHSWPYQSYVTTWNVTSYDSNASAAGKPGYDPARFDPALGYDPRLGGEVPRFLPDPDHDPYFLSAVQATDSASAATAMATGRKTEYGRLAWSPGDSDDGALETVAETLRRCRGFAIGIVSTVPFSHATPAAFVSHDLSRSNFYTGYCGAAATGIADEIVETTRPEVVIGGGHPAENNPEWSGCAGYLSRRVYETVASSTEYVFVERGEGAGAALLDAAGVAVSEHKKLFGLFGGADGNLESPVASDTPDSPKVSATTDLNPTLSQAVTAALEVLSSDPDGFFLMVEQGDIDWANHEHDYARMIATVVSLDEAVQSIVSFVERPDDAVDWSNTLVIVVADHGNGFLRLSPTIALGAGDLPMQEGGPGSYAYPGGEVSYLASGHTNELVSVSARGLEAERAEVFAEFEGQLAPGTRLLDNTALYSIMMRAAGERSAQ